MALGPDNLLRLHGLQGGVLRQVADCAALRGVPVPSSSLQQGPKNRISNYTLGLDAIETYLLMDLFNRSRTGKIADLSTRPVFLSEIHEIHKHEFNS